MKLSNKAYDILSFVGKILLPALALAYGSLADIWNWPLKSEVVQTIGVVATLVLNVFLQETSKNYYSQSDQTFVNDWNTGDKG